MIRLSALFFILTLSAYVTPALAAPGQQVIGEAGVTDGDTIRMPVATLKENGKTTAVQNVKIRLSGIDAPEKNQPCGDTNGTPYACGQVSLKAMADLIKGQMIVCNIEGVDRYRRFIAVCATPQNPDIGADMVRNGLAVAYRKYSTDYIDEEDVAREQRSGVWQGTFDMPWDWRKAH
jgi:endonuclease YncB( thermonuclease family)